MIARERQFEVAGQPFRWTNPGGRSVHPVLKRRDAGFMSQFN